MENEKETLKKLVTMCSHLINIHNKQIEKVLNTPKMDKFKPEFLLEQRNLVNQINSTIDEIKEFIFKNVMV